MPQFTFSASFTVYVCVSNAIPEPLFMLGHITNAEEFLKFLNHIQRSRTDKGKKSERLWLILDEE